MSLECILLGLLRTPASGYDLKAVFDERIHYFWAAELSQIYPTLQRMEKRGWLRKHRADSKRGPGRWLYETTPAGRQILREWLRGGPEMGDERFAFLAQIYLMDELGDLGETRRFFERMREQLAARLLALQHVEKHWAECDPHFPDSLPADWFHIHLTLRKGLISLAAHIRWCDECLRRISARLRKEKKNVRSISTVRRNQVDAHRRGKRGAAALLGPHHAAKGQ